MCSFFFVLCVFIYTAYSISWKIIYYQMLKIQVQIVLGKKPKHSDGVFSDHFRATITKYGNSLFEPQ